MAERDIKGTWKGKARGVSKSSSPMIWNGLSRSG